MVLTRLWKEARKRRGRARLERSIRLRRPGYFSEFGGTWTDRVDAEARLAAKLRSSALSPQEGRLVDEWMRDGYVVLPGAVPAQVVDAIKAEVESIWERGDASYALELGARYFPLDSALRSEPVKLLDLYARVPAALEAAFAPALRRFLGLLFQSEPLLFQSLSFERGSRQPIHQDAAYVVVESPLELAASWIALEDVQEGSGELEYYVGSHRLPGFVFPGGTRRYDSHVHDETIHARYLAGLHERSRELGLERRRHLPRKGDVLVWSADLAHGGSPVTSPEATRKSLVCHYCPGKLRPDYALVGYERPRVYSYPGGGRYCSWHYP
jgi:ectoine hydroxylase-related dioxygenase (phytanoyl-CoA dioxygenase family)